jgi:hypothetical protein
VDADAVALWDPAANVRYRRRDPQGSVTVRCPSGFAELCVSVIGHTFSGVDSATGPRYPRPRCARLPAWPYYQMPGHVHLWFMAVSSSVRCQADWSGGAVWRFACSRT